MRLGRGRAQQFEQGLVVQGPQLWLLPAMGGVRRRDGREVAPGLNAQQLERINLHVHGQVENESGDIHPHNTATRGGFATTFVHPRGGLL